MFSENIENDYIVIQEGTSEGTQVKYKKDGYWYKKDNRGNEGRAEYLVSKFMQFTTLQENEFISYEEGTINGKSGCRSKNFLDEEEELVTFYRLYYNEVGKDLSKVIANMNTMEERIEYVKKLNYKIVDELKEYPHVLLNHTECSLPHVINISLKGIKATKFAELLDHQGVYVSTKTSCCPAETPSKMIYALFHDRGRALSSFRISLSHLTTEKEIDEFLAIFSQCYKECFGNGKI